MRTLAIETATEACSVALFDDGKLVTNEHTVLGRGHAETLIPMIASLPENGKAERIIVSLGPGSFTGVRIGIAAARALGVAWGAKVLGYPSLALVAAIGQSKHGNSPVTVCMNGGHGEWFVQDFGTNGQVDQAVQSLSPDDVQARGTHNLVVGNRAEECAALFDTRLLAANLLPDASKTDLLDEATLTPDLSPIYGRAPDAKPQALAQS